MDDLISRQALLSVLHSKLGNTFTEYVIQAMINLIPSQNVEPELRWIPCSEGLPTIETDVLVTAHNGTAQYVAWVDAFEKWHLDEEEVIEGYEPLAWMPLPEPYKEEHNAPD